MHVVMKIIVLVTSWRMVCAADTVIIILVTSLRMVCAAYTNSDYCVSNIFKNGMCCLHKQWLLC